METIKMKIEFDKFKNKGLLIGTPMYGGMATANYYLSMTSLFYTAGQNNLNVNSYVLWNESLIPRARNEIVNYFLNTNMEYLMFIDGDISFNVPDVFYMWHLMVTNPDKKIIAGIYPKKVINWKSIKQAIDSNLIKTEDDLHKYAGDYVVNFTKAIDDVVNFSLSEPVEVVDAGTGFMMIHRSVFEEFKKAYPEQSYRKHFTNESRFAYFDCKIDEDDNTYLSEDYMFCRWAKKIGIKTWVIPWISLNHMGTYDYKTSFVDYSVMSKSLMDKKIQNIKLI